MISAFQKSAFQNNAFQIAATAKVGLLTGGRSSSGKRWFERLQEEYAARDPWQKPSHAKQAVKARKEVEKLVDEAIEDGRLTEEQAGAIELAQLVAKTKSARQVADTLRYANLVREHIKQLEDDDEDDVFILMAAF